MLEDYIKNGLLFIERNGKIYLRFNEKIALRGDFFCFFCICQKKAVTLPRKVL